MGDKTIAGQLLSMKTPKGVLRTDVQMGRDAAFDEAAALVAAIDAAEARDVGVLDSDWHMTETHNGVLIYSLKQDGWKKGEPVMVNDMAIRVELQNNHAGNSTANVKDVAARILSALHPASPLGAVAIAREYPDDVLDLVRRIGRAEWGATDPKTAALERVSAALEIAQTRHIPDQPAAYGGSELDWAQRQYASLRRAIIAALTPTADKE